MRALMVVAVVASGCKYGPIYGSPCDAGTPAECTTEKTAAYCEMGAWDEYTCASSCGTDGGCEWALADVGTHCPDSMEGRGACATSTSLMRCNGNRFALVRCARDCVTLPPGLGGGGACN